MNNRLHSILGVLIVWAMVGLYVSHIISVYPVVDEPVDWVSVATEGLMALMPAVGLLIILNLAGRHTIFWPLFVGLSLLMLALTTDTLDEFIEVTPLINNLVEGVLQVIGFLIVLVGLFNWIRYHEQVLAEMRHQATTDPLTSISNRRFFVDELKKEIATRQRHPGQLAVILFDIDHFKQINDSMGHDVGDEVLQEVCLRIKTQLREIDIFARYGGEEFVVVLKHAGVSTASHVAEKIRQVMGEIKIKGINGIKASFGIAEYRAEDSPEKLLKRADQALYQAKDRGRDQIVVQDQVE